MHGVSLSQGIPCRCKSLATCRARSLVVQCAAPDAAPDAASPCMAACTPQQCPSMQASEPPTLQAVHTQRSCSHPPVALAGEELAHVDLALGGGGEHAQAVRVARLELALVPAAGGGGGGGGARAPGRQQQHFRAAARSSAVAQQQGPAQPAAAAAGEPHSQEQAGCAGTSGCCCRCSCSLVTARHLAQVEAAAGAVAEGHDAHAVRDGLAGQALVPARWRCSGGAAVQVGAAVQPGGRGMQCRHRAGGSIRVPQPPARAGAAPPASSSAGWAAPTAQQLPAQQPQQPPSSPEAPGGAAHEVPSSNRKLDHLIASPGNGASGWLV
jgi:hypothetical protein